MSNFQRLFLTAMASFALGISGGCFYELLQTGHKIHLIEDNISHNVGGALVDLDTRVSRLERIAADLAEHETAEHDRLTKLWLQVNPPNPEAPRTFPLPEAHP